MKRIDILCRFFNSPLMIAPQKAQIIANVLASKYNEFSELAIYEGEISPEFAAPHRRAASSSSSGQEKGIAVIDVMGSLVHRARGMQAESGISSYESIGNAVRRAVADSHVGGILLRIDSPGGEVAGAFDLARIVREAAAEKPLWSFIEGMGLSAGYLIASQTGRIILSDHSSVGSIGVIMIHLDQSQADKQRGFDFTVLKRGARKDDFNPHAPLSKGAREWAEGLLDREYSWFVEHVASVRNVDEKKIRSTEAGIFYDEEALSLGLADTCYTTFSDAIGELHSFAVPALPIHPGGSPMADNNSPNPVPVPAASPPQPQQQPAPQPQPAAPPPQPAAQPQLPAQSHAQGVPLFTADDYKEIAALCTIARKPHLAAQFIQEAKTVAQVREILMKADTEQDEESEVFSAVHGKTGVAESLLTAKPKMTLAQSMRRRFGLKEA